MLQAEANGLSFRAEPPEIVVSAPKTRKQVAVTKAAAYSPDDPYAGMPAEVRIGSMVFRIEISEQADSAANSEFGHTNIINQKIRIQPRQSSLSLANTFLHEVLHAIHWMYGLWRNEPDEEHFTNQSANGLCAFFQDNPEATAWMLAINTRRGKE